MNPVHRFKTRSRYVMVRKLITSNSVRYSAKLYFSVSKENIIIWSVLLFITSQTG